MIRAIARRLRSSRLQLAALAAAFAVACQPDDEYGPRHDAAVMEAVTSVWAEQAEGGLVVSLCEDLERAETEATDAADGGCRTAHVVRGGGRGRAETIEHQSVGCGGCPLMAQGFVLGAVAGGGLPAPAAVHGEVTLTGDGSDAYVRPWDVRVWCDDPGAPCFASGELREDGNLYLQVRRGGWDDPAAVTTDHVLTRGGAAACPQ